MQHNGTFSELMWAQTALLFGIYALLRWLMPDVLPDALVKMPWRYVMATCAVGGVVFHKIVKLDHDHVIGVGVENQFNRCVDVILHHRHSTQSHQFQRGQKQADAFAQVRSLIGNLQRQTMCWFTLQPIQKVFLMQGDGRVVHLDDVLTKSRKID